MRKNKELFEVFIMFVSVIAIIGAVISAKNILYGPKIEELNSQELKKASTILDKITKELPRNENEEVNVKTVIVEYRDTTNSNRENIEVIIENGQVTQKRVKNENYKPNTMATILETYLRVVAIIAIGSIVAGVLFLLVRYKTPKIIRKWEFKEEKKEQRDTLI